MVAYFLAAALVVLYIVRSIRTYLSLKQFGGHWSAGWSRLWLLKTQSSGEMHKRFAALNRKHGEYSTRHGFFLVTTPLVNHAPTPIPKTTRFAAASPTGAFFRSRDTRSIKHPCPSAIVIMLLQWDVDIGCSAAWRVTMAARACG
jgi:hypothetical protein